MYEFDRTKSSPEYSQSDGTFENAVKTFKNLLKKAVQTDLDFQLTLLDWQNTPTEGMHSSPGQQMFCRRTRARLPTSRELLKPKLITDVREKKLNRKDPLLWQNCKGTTKSCHSQAANRKQRWTKALVEEQVNVRSYAVRTEGSKLLRRDCRLLRQSKEPFRPKEVHAGIPSKIL